MTSFLLKIIAIITMVIDHVGKVFFPTSLFILLGRISFPIFAFQLSEGFIHTSNRKKYFLRLLLFAFISQIPFQLFLSLLTANFSFNIFFTLALGLLALSIYDKIQNLSFNQISMSFSIFMKQLLGLCVAVFMGIIAELCYFDYGFFGIFIIFIFYVFHKKPLPMSISFAILCILKYLPVLLQSHFHYFYILSCLLTIVPIIFISMYHGKQGRKLKYLLYLFYPVHLLVLYLLFHSTIFA